MTYRDTVLSLLDYEMENRLTVDDHLFAVIGNGYEWKDGEIVYYVPDEYMNQLDSKPKSDEAMKAHYNELYEKYKNKYNDYNPPTGTIYDKFGGFEIYPICEFSLMYKIPEDVKSDWKEAILHFINYILIHKELLTDKDESLKYIEKTLERIKRL